MLTLHVCVCVFQLNRNQPVTLHDILKILRLHISVPQCDIFGYLSIDSEIIILIVPVDQQPTPLQVCVTITTDHAAFVFAVFLCVLNDGLSEVILDISQCSMALKLSSAGREVVLTVRLLLHSAQ